jgi:N-acetylglucosamine malate deacetylase 1
MRKTILIVAAHTDDEALGCGGTIARHAAEGATVYAIFLADGVSSRAGVNQDELVMRNAIAERARVILGIEANFYLGLPDNRLDSLPLIDIIQLLEPIVTKIQPNIIYTHHHGDLNIDHRITHQAILTVCRPLPSSTVEAIYSFEVMSSSEWATSNENTFVPNHFVDISKQINIKMEALKAYQVEMREAPHSRSPEHLNILALHRGYSVGMQAAEAFVTIRTLDR